MKKKFLSVLLAVLLVLTTVPLAFAAEIESDDVTQYGAYALRRTTSEGSEVIDRYLYLTLSERYVAVTDALSVSLTVLSYETYETQEIDIEKSAVTASLNPVEIDGVLQTRLQVVILYESPIQVRELRIGANSFADSAGNGNPEIVLEGEPSFGSFYVSGTGHSKVLDGDYDIFSLLSGALAGDGDTIDLKTGRAPVPYTICLDGVKLADIPANCEQTLSFQADGVGKHTLTLVVGNAAGETYPFEVLSQKDVYRGALSSAWGALADVPFLSLFALFLWWVPYLGTAAVLGTPILTALGIGNLIDTLFKGFNLLKQR
ncbi:MAG: hypothetical protein IKN72_10430 [Clostridia bacterium]|nr:hypothetical protein [Clostridia bacterium]